MLAISPSKPFVLRSKKSWMAVLHVFSRLQRGVVADGQDCIYCDTQETDAIFLIT